MNCDRKCPACPFNDGLNEEATRVQNYGCLPTKFDNLTMFDELGVSISCHETGQLCRGLLEERPAAAGQPVMPYSVWYQQADPMQHALEHYVQDLPQARPDLA